MSDQIPNSANDNEKAMPKLIQQLLSLWDRTCRFINKHHKAIAVVSAFAATLAAFLAVIVQNKVSRELATQQNFFQFYEQWESEGMQQRRARLAAELLDNRTPENIDDSPLVFLETLSNAAKRGLLDRELVFTSFYVELSGYWAAAQHYAKAARKSEHCNCIFKELESFSIQLIMEQILKGGPDASVIIHDRASENRFLDLERKRQLPEKRPNEAK